MGRTSSVMVGGALALCLGVAFAHSGSHSYSFSYTFEYFDDDVSFDGGMMCSNGVYGVESSNGLVCCDAGCGMCGGVGCSQFGAPDLDASDCCTTEIIDLGDPCSETGMAPCFIDDDWPVPMPPMPPMPPTPPATPKPEDTMCSNGVYGVESSNGAACCDAGCGICGGSGCSQFGAPDLDASDCCVTEIVQLGEACSETGMAPCFIDGDSPTTIPAVTCSNGIDGIESSNGAVCCAAGCGQCGGVGCSQAGAPDLGANDCCVTEILDFGSACSSTGTAPCFID